MGTCGQIILERFIVITCCILEFISRPIRSFDRHGTNIVAQRVLLERCIGFTDIGQVVFPDLCHGQVSGFLKGDFSVNTECTFNVGCLACDRIVVHLDHVKAIRGNVNIVHDSTEFRRIKRLFSAVGINADFCVGLFSVVIGAGDGNCILTERFFFVRYLVFGIRGRVQKFHYFADALADFR